MCVRVHACVCANRTVRWLCPTLSSVRLVHLERERESERERQRERERRRLSRTEQTATKRG